MLFDQEEYYHLPWDLAGGSQFNLPLMLRRAQEEKVMRSERLRWTLYWIAESSIVFLVIVGYLVTRR